MNIIEALKSGKRFRRRRWIESGHLPSTYWTPASDISTLNLRTEDILADDWEVEENKATITEEQLRQAWIKAHNNAPLVVQQNWIGVTNASRPGLYDALKKELGL